MARFFNTAGPCYPEKHYMLPAERRLPLVRPLVEQEQYFTVHAPRQSGKTTAFLALARELTAEGRYAALHASCEMGQYAGGDVEAGVGAVIAAILENARVALPEQLRPPGEPAEPEHVPAGVRLNLLLARWSTACPRPVVLFLDEIDALLDETLIAMLRQLRDGFSRRPHAFPQSVALIGLRDVRDYKVCSAIRPEAVTLGTASPFNIKSDSLTLSTFTAGEVAELLAQHTAETGQPFTTEAVAELFDQSQGQPWLVNALASICTTRPDALVPDRSVVVSREQVLQAKELLIERRDTHLDSLVDKLREERVRRVIEPILTGSVAFDPSFDDDFAYVRDLGLVTLREGVVTIANPIYGEIIPRVLSSHVQAGIALQPAGFVAADGTLDVERLLRGFVVFWQRHGEVLLRGMPYHEAAPHLVFMAYLQRVVNHGGRITREFAVGTGRADVVAELGGREDVFELKLVRGRWTLPEGLQQVAAYARRLGRTRGYLILFEPGSEVPWEERGRLEQWEEEGVAVTVLWA
ncbi:MAG: ATP-binding protein [Deltaproteobacteria bacterium]|nr:ATP-binding protein [Deltaproteobacteria bacterium]